LVDAGTVAAPLTKAEIVLAGTKVSAANHVPVLITRTRSIIGGIWC